MDITRTAGAPTVEAPRITAARTSPLAALRAGQCTAAAAAALPGLLRTATEAVRHATGRDDLVIRDGASLLDPETVWGAPTHQMRTHRADFVGVEGVHYRVRVHTARGRSRRGAGRPTTEVAVVLGTVDGQEVLSAPLTGPEEHRLALTQLMLAQRDLNVADRDCAIVSAAASAPRRRWFTQWLAR